MEKYEKIIELIKKEILSPEELQILNDLMKSDDDAKRLINVYNTLKSGLTKAVHLDLDLLSSYLLYEKGIDHDNALVPLLAEKIKLHLEDCLSCREEYDFLVKNYSEVGEHLNKSLIDNTEKQTTSIKHVLNIISRGFAGYKYAFATVVTVLVIYIGMFAISSITIPDYHANLFPEESEDFYRTRGRTSLSFQKGLDAIDKDNLSAALNFLNKDIEQYSDENSIFYTHYILGITYLKSAESNFLGFFNSFDEEKVSLAIQNLKSSIGKNTSGSYENLNLDANYYLGRAYMLVNNFDTAEKHFDLVITGKGRFYNEAQAMTESIKKN
jgi:tetratricopeptide (TPR) repeat protein